jgi:hypothetical protein
VDVNVFRRMIGDDFTSLPRGDLAAAIYNTIDDKVETILVTASPASTSTVTVFGSPSITARRAILT